jgi:hypothetical protein
VFNDNIFDNPASTRVMAQKRDDVKLLIGVLKHRLLVSRYPERKPEETKHKTSFI